ncbi:hypothetical protein JCM10449v2_001674 [Rhodotorula kratochvilovae]
MAPALTVQELRDALQALKLDSRGTKDTLRKRLARHTRSAASSSSRPTSPPPPQPRSALEKPEGQSYHSFLVFDVEATCQRIDQPWGKLAFAYPNEIIEWPVVLLQWRRKERDEAGQDPPEEEQWELVKTAEYHSFVKPVWAPMLSAFCTEPSLMQSPQDDVNTAPAFPELCKRFYRDFILPHRLFTAENRTIWVTDGPWDLRDFVAKTCYLSKMARPPWLAGEIIDLRNLTSAFFASLKKRSPSSSPPPAPAGGEAFAPLDEALATAEPPTPAPLPAPLAPSSSAAPTSSAPTDSSTTPSPPPTYLPSSRLTAPANLSLPSVLSALTLPPFDGRLHSGLSDARNAARILADLAARGVALEGNRRVPDGGRGGKERRWGWMDAKGGVRWEQWSERERGRHMEEERRKKEG